MTTIQTKKIIAHNESLNIWLIDGQVYRAPKYSTIDVNGYPTAARWECSESHWNLYRDTAYRLFTDI